MPHVVLFEHARHNVAVGPAYVLELGLDDSSLVLVVFHRAPAVQTSDVDVVDD